MRYLLSLPLAGLLLPAVTLGQSWMGADPAPPPAMQETPVLVSLGAVEGDGSVDLEVISLNGRTRVRSRPQDGALEVWRTMSGQPPRRLFAGMERVTALALDRAGRRVAAGDSSGQVRVWNWEADRSPFYQDRLGDPISRIRYFGRDGERLAAFQRTPEGDRKTVIDLESQEAAARPADPR